jgi:hypothetical protein
MLLFKDALRNKGFIMKKCIILSVMLSTSVLMGMECEETKEKKLNSMLQSHRIKLTALNEKLTLLEHDCSFYLHNEYSDTVQEKANIFEQNFEKLLQEKNALEIEEKVINYFDNPTEDILNQIFEKLIQEKTKKAVKEKLRLYCQNPTEDNLDQIIKIIIGYTAQD